MHSNHIVEVIALLLENGGNPNHLISRGVNLFLSILISKFLMMSIPMITYIRFNAGRY